MEWWRTYHGLCTDPKLHRLARSIHVSRGLVVAGWVAVMETASANSARGNVGQFSHVELAFMVDVKPHVGLKIWDAFLAAGMIDAAGNVTAWAKRQRQSDDSGVRKRKFREREAEGKPLKTLKTKGSRHGTIPSVEQIRTEQKETPPGEGAQAPDMAKAALWREMKAQVGGNHAGSLVGKWVKVHGLPAVMDAHFAAMANMPADYVEWMAKRLQANGKAYAARMPQGGKSYSELTRESLTDDDEQGLETLHSVLGEAPVLCPGRAYHDA